MPSYPDKNGKTRFSMNPQVGKSMFGGDASAIPGMDQLQGADGDDDHVELHKGGHPEGDPPPSDMTKYHTIHGADIKNHDDYDSADSHMKECMGESLDDMGDSDQDGSSTNPGDSAVFA